MKKNIFLLILTFVLFLPLSLVRAQEASSADTLTDKIKERLQETAEQGLDTIKANMTEEAKSPRQKAYVGSISAVNDGTITLQYKTDTLTVNFDDQTDIIQAKGHAALDPQDLAVDDYLLAFGFVYPDNPALKAVEIQRIAKPEAPSPRQLLSGPIEEIDGNKLTVSGKTLTITNGTDLTISQVDEPSVDVLALDDYLFAIVTLDQNGDIDEINSVLVFPGKNNPLGEEPTNSAEASTAAEPEASPTQ